MSADCSKQDLKIHKRAALLLTIALIAAPGSTIAANHTAAEAAIGSSSAPVTVVEYCSATSPLCARFHTEVFPILLSRYITSGKVRYIFREVLTPPVEVASAIFLLARCHGQRDYFTIIDRSFQSQREWIATGDVHQVLLRVARSVGITEVEFNACISDQMSLTALKARVEHLTALDHIDSTPTFVINGRHVSGVQSTTDLSKLIDPLLTQKR